MKRSITINLITLIIICLLWGLSIALSQDDPRSSFVFDVIIFSGSFLLFLWNMYVHKTSLISWIREGRVRIVITLSAILIIELSFMLKNQLVPTYAYFFGVLFGLMMWSVLALWLKGSFRTIFLLITLVIFLSYAIGQDVYYRIFREFFSFKEALTLREGIESGDGMYRFHILHLWVGSIGLVSGFLLLKYKEKKVPKRRISMSFYLSIGFLSVLLLLNFNVPHRDETLFSSDYYLYSSVYSKRNFAQHFGFFHLMGRDLVDTIIPIINTENDQKIIEEYLKSIEKAPSVHEHVGEFAGKNLIFILAESYDEIALDPWLTPHLYRLKTEGYDFVNHYTPVFQRTTSDTEFIFNTGWIPSIEDGPTVSIFQDNTYLESLANRFNSLGYLTQAFHGNYKEFYGRHIIYENYGYDHFFGRDELGLTANEGLFDATFFNHAKDLILPENTPFMSFIITFSGHSPYNELHQVGDEHYDIVHSAYPNIDEELKYYLAVQVELDLMVGELFKALEEKDLLENTVILLSGDHYPYTMTQSIYEKASLRKNDDEKYQGNLYLWSLGITPQTIQKQTTSYDILPTLSVLFHLPLSDIDLGHDMFSTLVTPVYTKHYAYLMNGTYISLTDSNPENYLERQRIAQHYLLAKKLLRTNYLGTR